MNRKNRVNLQKKHEDARRARQINEIRFLVMNQQRPIRSPSNSFFKLHLNINSA